MNFDLRLPPISTAKLYKKMNISVIFSWSTIQKISLNLNTMSRSTPGRCVFPTVTPCFYFESDSLLSGVYFLPLFGFTLFSMACLSRLDSQQTPSSFIQLWQMRMSSLSQTFTFTLKFAVCPLSRQLCAML